MNNPVEDMVTNQRLLAKEARESLKRKKIKSPQVSDFKYKVQIGTCLHMTNSKNRYNKLLDEKNEYEQR